MKRYYIVFMLMMFGSIQVSSAMEIKGHIDSVNEKSITIRYDGDLAGSVGDMAKVTFIQIDGSERVIGKWKIVTSQGRLSAAKHIEVFEKPGIGQNVVVYGEGEKIEPSLPVVQSSGKEPKPIKPELDPNKPNSIDPNHPKVATLIKEWISVAEPPMNATDGANARYEPYGRWVGEGINGIIGKVTANPDDVAGRTPEKYVWDKRNKLDSVDNCTLGEYVIAKLKNDSIDHCNGRYKEKNNTKLKKQAEELIKKAKDLWKRGSLAEAIKTAKKASQIVPKDTKIAKIHTAMQKQKKTIDNKLNTVSSKIKNNKLKEAEAELARASRISTEYPRYKKAKKELEDAKTEAKEERKRKEQAEKLMKKAKDLWKRGALGEAIRTAKKASRIVPKDTKIAKIHKAMNSQKKIMDNALSECDSFIGREEFKKAKRTLKKAERISSNYPPYVKMLDKLRKVKEKFDQIKKIIKEAKQEWKRKKQQSAISKLDKVLTIDPMHKEAVRLKKEWEKILSDQAKASKPNWDNGCYNGENTGGAMLQWTLRDPPPYSGLTPICSDRDGKLWILNNHISQIIKGKLNRYGCYSGSTVKAKNRDYGGTLCRPQGYVEKPEDKPVRPDIPVQVNGTLWDWWAPIYGYGKKCLTKEEVAEHMKVGVRPDKDGWYARKNGGSMKPTGKSCTKPRKNVKPSGGDVVVTDVVGLSKKQAEKKLKEIGLNTKIVIGDPAPSMHSGLKVQKSIPTSGKTIKRGGTVTLVVHPPFVDRRTVPSLTGVRENEVIKKIKNAGLTPSIRKVKASSASQSGKISSVKPPSGSEIRAGSTVYVDIFEDFGGGSDGDPWVDKVVSFTRPPGSSDEGFGADSALGPPTEGKFVAIDKPETIIFAFTDNVVVDGEGNDLKLHEYINGDSLVEVSVSTDNRRYISLEKTSKSAEYDLAKYNLSTVRYVKLVGLGDGGAAKGYDLMAIEALNSSADKITTFVDTVEDFSSRSTKNESKCTKYNECLTEMMQEIQPMSLNMASGESASFGCKYLGLGEAISKVAQDANSAGCSISGNYAHTGDMIKATARQMCAGQSMVFDVNKFDSCRNMGVNPGDVRKPRGGKIILSDSVDDFNAGKVIKVPNVVGLSIRDASKRIKSVGLQPAFKLGAKTNYPRKDKTVASQEPKAGRRISPENKVKMSVYTLSVDHKKSIVSSSNSNENKDTDKTTTFVDTVEDFGGKNTNAKAEKQPSEKLSDIYNEALKLRPTCNPLADSFILMYLKDPSFFDDTRIAKGMVEMSKEMKHPSFSNDANLTKRISEFEQASKYYKSFNKAQDLYEKGFVGLDGKPDDVTPAIKEIIKSLEVFARKHKINCDETIGEISKATKKVKKLRDTLNQLQGVNARCEKEELKQTKKIYTDIERIGKKNENFITSDLFGFQMFSSPLHELIVTRLDLINHQLLTWKFFDNAEYYLKKAIAHGGNSSYYYDVNLETKNVIFNGTEKEHDCPNLVKRAKEMRQMIPRGMTP